MGINSKACILQLSHQNEMLQMISFEYSVCRFGQGVQATLNPQIAVQLPCFIDGLEIREP